ATPTLLFRNRLVCSEVTVPSLESPIGSAREGATPTPTPGGLKFTDPGPQTCKFNQSCTVQLATTGAKPPVRYAATGLPWGLTLDSASGRITGKPWGSGVFQVTATASDATGATAGTTFTLTLNWF
ncbi:putative Ig domain-containing protein, partial [Streptomyces sp. NPDC001584]|uniref:putative Ig domain-containing protein n=1 Tax=Streptomyces sp. NPDC001584 TaxID=3154521 RepID=UPI003317A1E5